MKTHEVLDITLHEEEGQSCFSGTYQECLDFISEQGSFGYQIVPIIQ